MDTLHNKKRARSDSNDNGDIGLPQSKIPKHSESHKKTKIAEKRRILLVNECEHYLNSECRYCSFEFEPTDTEILLLSLQDLAKCFNPKEYKGPNAQYTLLTYFANKYKVKWLTGDPFSDFTRDCDCCKKDCQYFYHGSEEGPVAKIKSEFNQKLKKKMDKWVNGHDWIIKYSFVEDRGWVGELLEQYITYLKNISKIYDSKKEDSYYRKQHAAANNILEDNPKLRTKILNLDVDKILLEMDSFSAITY